MQDLYKAIDSLRKIDEGKNLAEEELSKCCDAPISDGPGDAEGRCTSCGEVVSVDEGKNKMGPQEIAVGDRVEFEGEKFEVLDVELDTIVADNLVTGLRNRLPTDKVTRLFGADAQTDQDKEDMSGMFDRLEKSGGSHAMKHTATEDDTLKIGTTSDMEDKHYPITYTADISYDSRDRTEVDNIVIHDKNGEMLPPDHPVYQAEVGFIEDEVKRTGEEAGEVVGEAIEDMENIEERVTYSTLAKLSGIKDPNKIFPGQKIKLPGGGSYTVKRGDTLSGIAQDYRLKKISNEPKKAIPMPKPRPKPEILDLPIADKFPKVKPPMYRDRKFDTEKYLTKQRQNPQMYNPLDKDSADKLNRLNKFDLNKSGDYKLDKTSVKQPEKKVGDDLINKISNSFGNTFKGSDKKGSADPLKLSQPKTNNTTKVAKRNMIKRITGANT